MKKKSVKPIYFEEEIPSQDIQENSKHYRQAVKGYEPWDIFKRWNWFPEFAKANIVKYIWRAGKKEGCMKDLYKATQTRPEL